MKYILLNCYHRCPGDPQNNTSYSHLLLVAWKNLAKNTIAENTTHMGHRAWRYQADADQEASTLLATSHCTRRCYAGFKDWEGEVNRNLIQLGTLGTTGTTVTASYTHQRHHGMATIGVLIHSLIGFKRHYRRESTCLCCKSGQEPMARESQAPELSLTVFC